VSVPSGSGEAPSCTTTGRVICDASLASAIVASPSVTVTAGTGPAPTPSGGVVVGGAYQLVAETIYGSLLPDMGAPFPGATVSAVLNVTCDRYNEIYSESTSASSGSGNTCGRLVPQAIGLLDPLNTSESNTNDPWGDDMPYTATDSTLSLIQLAPYNDLEDRTIGWYVVVEDHTLITTSEAARFLHAEHESGAALRFTYAGKSLAPAPCKLRQPASRPQAWPPSLARPPLEQPVRGACSATRDGLAEIHARASGVARGVAPSSVEPCRRNEGTLVARREKGKPRTAWPCRLPSSAFADGKQSRSQRLGSSYSELPDDGGKHEPPPRRTGRLASS
jgi:hypothetical protein